MFVIPVVDIQGGQAVRAVGGDRANYRPIVTPLAPGTSDPVAVAGGLLGACGGVRPSLYVAELDGIEGRGRNLAAIERLAGSYGDVRLMVDDGSKCARDVAAYRALPNVRPVIGTETLANIAALREISAVLPAGFVLSLDWRGGEPLGPVEAFNDASSWPQTVVVMTLARVGGRAGPDFARIAEVKGISGAREVLAAGGVRGLEDLKRLRGAGAAGALVATALHEGSLRPCDIELLG